MCHKKRNCTLCSLYTEFFLCTKTQKERKIASLSPPGGNNRTQERWMEIHAHAVWTPRTKQFATGILNRLYPVKGQLDRNSASDLVSGVTDRNCVFCRNTEAIKKKKTSQGAHWTGNIRRIGGEKSLQTWLGPMNRTLTQQNYPSII